jgi:hypothetical protein
MIALPSCTCLEKLDALRADLADFAYQLDRRGRADAADVANTLAARIAVLRDELVRENAPRDVRTAPAGSSRF